jgi:thiamine pyrophosphokinase
MRVLLVCAAPYEGDPCDVAELSEQHELVVAVDGGGALCRRAGVLPDLIIGDFDSLPVADLEHLTAAGSEVVRYSSHKDETDLGLALEIVRDRGATGISVTAALSGRLDHSLATLGLLARAADLSPECYEPDLRAWVLSSSGRMSLGLTGEGATFSVIALCEGSCVTMDGARWSGVSIELGLLDTRGVSNVIESSPTHITVEHGTVLVFSSPEGCVPIADNLG